MLHSCERTRIAISPNGRWLVIGGDSATSRVLDLSQQNTAAKPIALRGASDGVRTLAISPNNRWLVTGSSNRTFVTMNGRDATTDDAARVWDLDANDPGAMAYVLSGHKQPINCIAISGDSRWAVTGSVDHTARVWELSSEQGRLVRELSGHTAMVNSVAISADGRTVVTVGEDGAAFLWGLADEPISCQPLRGHEHPILTVAMSPDGRWIATGGSFEPSRIWDLQGPDPLSSRMIPGHGLGWIVAVTFSSDSRWLATGCWGRSTNVWNLLARDPIASPFLSHQNDSSVHSLAFSNDCRWLVSGSAVNPRVLDLSARDPSLTSIALRTEDIRAVALTPDNRWVVTSDRGGAVQLWDLNINTLLARARQLIGRQLTSEERRHLLTAND